MLTNLRNEDYRSKVHTGKKEGKIANDRFNPSILAIYSHYECI